ncbi:MAG: DNA topoisomerase, partial [Verrucomicrobia bacterium]|nr:DNA topoisomerase [Verrucomicrobiota bacterium]
NDEKAEIKSEEQAATILAELEKRKLRVQDIVKKPVTRRASPPFITSSLQQAGSSSCGYSPKRTMALAQRLYEGIDLGDGPAGLITYMRTDSVSVSRDAQAACRAWVKSTYGDDYVPEKPNVYKSRGSAQEAHEAIRPTDVALTPDRLRGKLDSPEWKLYRLIWDRFVASQMSPAKIEQCTIKIEAEPAPEGESRYLFHASSSNILFAGYMKVYKTAAIAKAKDDDGEGDGAEDDQTLPPLAVGEPLTCLKWLSDRKETKPPPRFSEASLVRELESNGVGRPSTYASIISTLQQRTYVSREKRMLVPSPLGRRVNELLVESLGKLFNVTFTASMEESLDAIERGEQEWTSMLGGFYTEFEQWMQATKLPPAEEAHVQGVLDLLTGVTDWAPEVKRGKRTYSDDRFIQSIHKQIADGKRAVSQRQLEALVKMAWRYRPQLPDTEARLNEMGFAELLASPELQPPMETTERKLEIAAGLELAEQTSAFVESLDGRVKSGRRLTPAQIAALNNVLLANASKIENFEALRVELDLGNEDQEDKESGPLLEAMSAVKEWNPPVQRGKRTFNDQEFYISLSGHHEARGFLSPRQRAALKRMVKRYNAQIPHYKALAEQWDLGPTKK